MFQNTINNYLKKKNRELEQALSQYVANEEKVTELTKKLLALESEWDSEIEKLKNTRNEYTTLIREVKILRAELLRAKKRKEALNDSD